MASTIVRSEQKQGLVLLESSSSVAEDGMVTVSAEFLAPSTQSTSGFELDASWPGGVALPVGLPTLQGGPYLLTRSINKKNGLVYISATYVSAVNPPRLLTTNTTNNKTFNGQAEDGDGDVGTLAFDYVTNSVSYSYAVLEGVAFGVTPVATVGRKFNYQKSGNSDLVKTFVKQNPSATENIVGKVRRIQVSAEISIEQDDSVAAPEVPFWERSFGVTVL
jgi:hypothetical protein